MKEILEHVLQYASKDEGVLAILKGYLDDLDYISRLQIKDILPKGYAEMEFVELSGIRGMRAVNTLKAIEYEEIGTSLPWDYLDGPFAFEFGGREKREFMRDYVKRLLVSCGVSETLVDKLSKRN